MKPKRNYEITYQSVRSKNYLIKQNQMFEVSDHGIEIWQLLNGERTVDEVVEIMAERYRFDASHGQERNLIEQFISFLQDKQMLD